MAETSAATGLTPQQWDDQFFVEHIQENRFSSNMGSTTNSVIHVKEKLSASKGDTMTWGLVNRLTGAGVTDGGTLEGNEEDMVSRSFALTIKERANAVVFTTWEEQKSAIGLRPAAKETLMTWATENTRDQIITALGSINGVAYGSASEAQKDAWLVDNTDRVLFGAAVGNHSTDHSAALANVDSTNDKLTASALSLMKRIARTANPKIRPIRSTQNGGRYYYVAYVPSLVFRDLKADTTITQAQREVSLAMQNEKLFEGGDIMWDGIICKEIEDIGVLSGVGNSGINVAPVYLCGAQAVGYGICQRWKSVDETRDYGRKRGVAVCEMGAFGKLRFGSGSGDTDDSKDHGVVTGFFSAVADS